MTVIIGALCTNGVVIGCDSSATYSDGSGKTIEQPTSDKIEIISSPPVITAVTGQFGLAQRFREILKRPNTLQSIERDIPLKAARMIAGLTVEDFIATKATKGEFGALMASHHNGTFALCEYAEKDFQPEFKTEERWFAAMGSGQRIVDPFLALMRRIFWPNSQPTVSGGIFAVMWALDLAIEVNPGGINGPARIAVLEMSKKAGHHVARWLDEDELDEHKDNVVELEEHLREYRRNFGGSGGLSTKEQPAPPK
jgi:hypothetical protein